MNTFDNKTFITTTLPYVNSKPHIGHSFEFILADSISRFLKTKTNVHFNIGLDEHGLKVWTKANDLGISPETHIKNLTEVWLDFCDKFKIGYDSFYKTSNISHHEKVKVIWNRFIERGDIYKKSYIGKYCVGCESFKLDKELINGKCSDHPTTEITSVEEENYFFKLSKYRESLLKWVESNPNFLQPTSKLEELKNLIISSDDISVSRLKENCPWGIDVPNDDTQIIYVWFEALWNYPFAAGYLTDNFNWDNVIQLCGPDNLRFQAIIFQAFLESEGIKNTDKLLVHGTILDNDGKKMSKTLGNVVDPFDQLEKFGLNAVRYYTLAGLNTYSDSGWSETDLINLYNSDICNDWGNLISRVLHLCDVKSVSIEVKSNEIITEINSRVIEVRKLWSTFKVKDALSKTNGIVKYANQYISDKKPWSKEITIGECSEILNNLHYLLREVNKLYLPVFPDVYPIIDISLNECKKVIIFNKLN